MKKIDCIKLSEKSFGFIEGNRYAVVQKTPYVQGTCIDFFKSIKEAKKFIKNILENQSTLNWVSESERIRLRKFCDSVRVKCPKCGNEFDTTQTKKKYISCKCSAKFKEDAR